MPCGRLKRTLDCESCNQIPSKRRRFNQFEQVTGRPPSSVRFSNTTNSRTGCGAAGGTYNVLRTVNQSPSCSATPSVFSEARISKISTDKIKRYIADEMKRLIKRKELSLSTAAFEGMQLSEFSASEMGPDSLRRLDCPPSIVRNPEKALFTFKQVQLICDRMLKEREEEIREEYDTVLNTKLAEQYDVFVKFTFDQIQKRYESAPSYFS